MLVELHEDLCDDQVSAPRTGSTRKWPIALIGFAIVVTGVALLKGSGAKSAVFRWLHLTSPRSVTSSSAPTAQVRSHKPGGNVTGPADPAIGFEKVMLPASYGVGFTCLQIGPDRRLYASADDGRVFRFPIQPDGTLGSSEIMASVQLANHGERLLTGFCIDPASTADAPVLWAAHSGFGFSAVADWQGKISRIRGAHLEIVEDVVVRLPRSAKDHATFQPSFGPDGALYFAQGSNTALGEPDKLWSDRPEHLLSASILRLDVSKIVPGHPLDAQTDDGGTYDPFAAGAPLTIYATGVRVAYDLCWASNGRLYAPANGACVGGNTPAGPGGTPPSLKNVMLDEHDWLFKVEPGGYYGHPNPRQRHYVLNGGNPTNDKDLFEMPFYPAGTRPDSQWQPAIYDFGLHVSPNGIIEYRGNACAGKLNGKLLVCRYNVGGDIICITLDAKGNVVSTQAGIPGLSDFSSPLDLVQDPSTGFIYISEYGAQRITLARPQ
jgi:glucose/arabinose dehydrogenase